jgi:hypothetical protein
LNPTAGSTAPALASQIDPNLQVLTLGPVHEAFGQPVLFNPGPNPIIPNKPPAPVEEIPPSMKPAGNDVEWISGYWSWDATQQKFVWTSGIWRMTPPGLAWVPGYWTHSGIAYQWVSGYWRRSETATALASFTKQLGVNRPGDLATGSSTAPTNPTAATGSTNAPKPAPAANPVPGAAPNQPASPAAFPDPLAALAGDASTPGAIPGPSPTADPVPGLAPDPTVGPAGFAAAAPNASPGDPNSANPAPPNPAGTSGNGAPFVPQPPASLESGPVGNPPTADYTWIPGTWIYRHGRFLWLAGQWAPIHRGWVWIPAHYASTPAGYVFVDGYWDYELARRGVLFAPVSFRRGYHGWGFSYTPSVVLNTDLLTDCLFVNGPCGCYCFGDYYGANCAQAGIFPWFAFHMSSLGYDPCFAFCSWAHHNDAGWHKKLIDDFRALRSDARLRPPRTFDDLAAQTHRSGARFESLAMPPGKFVADNGRSSMRFENVSNAERNGIDRSLQRSHEAASTRLELETKSSRNKPADVYLHDPRGGAVEANADDRREGKRESKIAEDRGKSKIAEDRTESKIANSIRNGWHPPETSLVKDGKRFAETKSVESKQTRSGKLSTTRTPPVVARRPVSTAGLGQHGIQESPDQRLANPKFVPQATNRGRAESTEKNVAGRRH